MGKNNDALSRKIEYPKLINELEVKLKAINAREIVLGREAKEDHSKSNLLHIVRQNKATLLTEKKQLEALYAAIELMYGPDRVYGYIYGTKFYPGVSICIDMREKMINEEMVRIRFKCNEEKIDAIMEKD